MFPIEPIGFVAEAEEPTQTSTILVYDEYIEGLKGVEGHDYLVIIYRFHKSHETPLLVHPHGESTRPLTGVFATRSPRRPNQLGLTTVRLVDRRGNRVFVEGLDALVGTPVIDIKPYSPTFDEPHTPAPQTY